MTEPPRDDWDERARLAEQTRQAIAECGPMSMAEGHYLMLREAGVPDMEARLATRTRGGRSSRRLTAAQILDLVRGVTPEA